MFMSKQCQDYEAHALKIRNFREPFPMSIQDLLVYIRYRGRNSKFCDYLYNLEMHPLHGKDWLKTMNNNESVRAEIDKFIKIWGVYLPHYPTLIGAAHRMIQPQKISPLSEKNKVEPTSSKAKRGYIISRPETVNKTIPTLNQLPNKLSNQSYQPSNQLSNRTQTMEHLLNRPIKSNLSQTVPLRRPEIVKRVQFESSTMDHLLQPTRSIEHKTVKKQKFETESTTLFNKKTKKKDHSECTEPYILIEKFDMPYQTNNFELETYNKPQQTTTKSLDSIVLEQAEVEEVIKYYVLDSPEPFVEDESGNDVNEFKNNMNKLENDLDDFENDINVFDGLEDDVNDFDGFENEVDEVDEFDGFENNAEELNVSDLEIGSKFTTFKQKANDTGNQTNMPRSSATHQRSIVYESEEDEQIVEEEEEDYYDVKAYMEYIKDMEKKKYMERLTGIRIGEGPLYILSHVAIEKSFR